jgi:voltage-gated potassium channel Kch
MANTKKAKVLALTCPDPMAQLTATHYAKEVNHDIAIIASVPDESGAERLNRLGITEAVIPAFEVSLEFVRHTLMCYQIDILEIERIACPFTKERGLGSSSQKED